MVRQKRLSKSDKYVYRLRYQTIGAKLCKHGLRSCRLRGRKNAQELALMTEVVQT